MYICTCSATCIDDLLIVFFYLIFLIFNIFDFFFKVALRYRLHYVHVVLVYQNVVAAVIVQNTTNVVVAILITVAVLKEEPVSKINWSSTPNS